MAAAAKSFGLVIGLLREDVLKTRHFRPNPVPIYRKMPGRCGKFATARVFFAAPGCLTKFKHSPARVVPSGPPRDRLSRVPTGFTGARPIHAHHAFAPA